MAHARSSNHYVKIYDKFYKPSKAEISFESVERILSNFVHLQDVMNHSLQDIGIILGEALKIKTEIAKKNCQDSKPALQVIDNKISGVKFTTEPTDPSQKFISLNQEPINSFIKKSPCAEVQSSKQEESKKKKSIFLKPKQIGSQMILDDYIMLHNKIPKPVNKTEKSSRRASSIPKIQVESQSFAVVSDSANIQSQQFTENQIAAVSNNYIKNKNTLRGLNPKLTRASKANSKNHFNWMNELEFDALEPKRQSKEDLKVRLIGNKNRIFDLPFAKNTKNIFGDHISEGSHREIISSKQFERSCTGIIEENPQSPHFEKNLKTPELEESGNTNLFREVYRKKKLRDQQNGYACHVCQKVTLSVLRRSG